MAVTSPWSTPVATLAGVGPKTADKLRSAGYATIGQLALHVPHAYEDRRVTHSLAQAEVGDDILVEGSVRRFRERFFRGRYRAQLELEVIENGASVPLVARWFHRVGGLRERARDGVRIQLFGTLKRGGKQGRGRRELVHPKLQPPGAQPPGIVVRYPAIEGIGAATVARYCRAAAEHTIASFAAQGDWLPREFLARHRLPSAARALQQLHMPENDLTAQQVADLRARVSPGHRRLTFDRLLAMQLNIAARRVAFRRRAQAVCLVPESSSREHLRAVLPFEPTEDQWRAIADIEADLAVPRPMMRLLQGDVGSGKTAVAFAACVAMVRARGQIAWMVPTELLAHQHARTLADGCRRAGIRSVVVTAKQPAAARRRYSEQIASAQIDLVIGTHALLSEKIQFARLGLAIIDEQQRFGVAQRAVLRKKGTTPHLLVMTATPIPRTLALIGYGELDLSVIRQLPPGRRPPSTQLFAGTNALATAREHLASLVERGMQAFAVCPRIGADGALEISHVGEASRWFRARLPHHKLAVIHGKCPQTEVARAVAAFASGEVSLLVATTVIEVGVDLPAARAMSIEHADRFGLAQLHQLRGRVGRGQGPSVCLLHTQKKCGTDAHTRLQVLVDASDGFTVAEQDLAHRGPGEVFGTRQAGTPGFYASCLTGAGVELLLDARKLARAWVSDRHAPVHTPCVSRYLQAFDSPERTGEAG